MNFTLTVSVLILPCSLCRPTMQGDGMEGGIDIYYQLLMGDSTGPLSCLWVFALGDTVFALYGVGEDKQLIGPLLSQSDLSCSFCLYLVYNLTRSW